MSDDWKQAYRAAYVKAHGKAAPHVNEWWRGWYYVMDQNKVLSFKPALYRRKQIEEMTARLLARPEAAK